MGRLGMPRDSARFLVLQHGQDFFQGGIASRIGGRRGAVEFGDDEAEKLVELGLGLGEGRVGPPGG